MEGGIASSKLDFDNPNREKMRKVVLIVLKKVVDLSNANLIKNIDGLISNKSTNQGVEWRGGGGGGREKAGKRGPENKFKMSY